MKIQILKLLLIGD